MASNSTFEYTFLSFLATLSRSSCFEMEWQDSAQRNGTSNQLPIMITYACI